MKLNFVSKSKQVKELEEEVEQWKKQYLGTYTKLTELSDRCVKLSIEKVELAKKNDDLSEVADTLLKDNQYLKSQIEKQNEPIN